jgi:hypothetical protein
MSLVYEHGLGPQVFKKLILNRNLIFFLSVVIEAALWKVKSNDDFDDMIFFVSSFNSTMLGVSNVVYED